LEVFVRAGHLGGSIEELSKVLDSILMQGGMGVEIKDGEKLYFNIPLVVGMFEMQIGRHTPEFIKDFNAYTSHSRFGLNY